MTINDNTVLTQELLGTRAFNMVRNFNVNSRYECGIMHKPQTIGDLRRMSDADLLRTPHFGLKSLKALKILLK